MNKKELVAGMRTFVGGGDFISSPEIAKWLRVSRDKVPNLLEGVQPLEINERDILSQKWQNELLKGGHDDRSFNRVSPNLIWGTYLGFSPGGHRGG